MAQIHELIGKVMAEVGAIGKNSRNEQQKFNYRGIDDVYNALSPVMSKYGLFFCPEVVDQKREERVNTNGKNLIYTVLTVKYTVYAPDGSNITITIVGEGMDMGDKSANKAMSAAMKYAAFQLFFIPTEELKDPDAETHEVAPKHEEFVRPEPAVNAKVEVNPVFEYIANEKAFMAQRLGISKEEMKIKFAAFRKSLIQGNVIEDIPATELTMVQARVLIDAIYKNFFSDKKDDAK